MFGTTYQLSSFKIFTLNGIFFNSFSFIFTVLITCRFCLYVICTVSQCLIPSVFGLAAYAQTQEKGAWRAHGWGRGLTTTPDRKRNLRVTISFKHEDPFSEYFFLHIYSSLKAHLNHTLFFILWRNVHGTRPTPTRQDSRVKVHRKLGGCHFSYRCYC